MNNICIENNIDKNYINENVILNGESSAEELHSLIKNIDSIKADYILDIEYMTCVADIFANEKFNSMDNIIQHGDTTTKIHSIQVSYLSYRICKRMGLDSDSAARSGLLHDFFLYDWHTHSKETGNYFHGFTHPRVALNNANNEFELNDIEQDAILRHMWPLTIIPPMSIEGMVLIYADKMCTILEVCKHFKKMIRGRVKWNLVKNW
jgi:Predicted HD superfamily hydrolase